MAHHELSHEFSCSITFWLPSKVTDKILILGKVGWQNVTHSPSQSDCLSLDASLTGSTNIWVKLKREPPYSWMDKIALQLHKWTFQRLLRQKKGLALIVGHCKKRERSSILNIILSSGRIVLLCITISWITKIIIYSRVRNKHSRTLINFLTFIQGLWPYSGLHSIR